VVVLTTPNGLFPGEVGQVLDDNTLLIYFWNGQGGSSKPKSAIYPAYLEPDDKPKEVYTYEPNATQSMQPTWDIKPVTAVVGPTWMPELKGGKQYLPTATQQIATKFLKPKGESTGTKTKKIAIF
jgi:hypothetical protein